MLAACNAKLSTSARDIRSRHPLATSARDIRSRHPRYGLRIGGSDPGYRQLGHPQG
jgi:hypothetical protein